MQVTRNRGVITMDCTQEEYDMLFHSITLGGYSDNEKDKLQRGLIKDMISECSDKHWADFIAARGYQSV